MLYRRYPRAIAKAQAELDAAEAALICALEDNPEVRRRLEHDRRRAADKLTQLVYGYRAAAQDRGRGVGAFGKRVLAMPSSRQIVM